MSKSPGAKPIGRPTDYRPEMCGKVIAAMATGLSLDAAAAEIGISPRSAYKFQREFPKFAHAVEQGRALSLAFWERRSIAVATGQPGNAAIISLGLRNRSRSASGWHEAVRTEHSGPDGQPMQVEQKSTIDVSGLNTTQLHQLRDLLLLEKAGVESSKPRP
jgi:hypothetical protein